MSGGGVGERRATAVCDPGVLVYRLDASIPNGDGSIRVHDAALGSGQQGRCSELDIGTLGLAPGKASTFRDGNVTIRVVSERPGDAVVKVSR